VRASEKTTRQPGVEMAKRPYGQRRSPRSAPLPARWVCVSMARSLQACCASRRVSADAARDVGGTTESNVLFVPVWMNWAFFYWNLTP